MAESLRSGLGSVEKTQIEAAAAAQERRPPQLLSVHLMK